MSAPLPLPEPPSDDVAQLLDSLRLARRELADAARIAYVLALPHPGPPPLMGAVRLGIEQAVAERRCELWVAEVVRLVADARAAGLDVADDL